MEKVKFEPKQDIITCLVVVMVCFIQGLAINGFYMPNHFLSGGVTGISLLVEYLWGFPAWVVVIILNIPVTILGLKYLNIKYMIFSTMAVVIYAAAVELTRGFSLNISDPLVSAIAGAAVIGVTSACVIKREATLGGMDVISVILSRKWSVPMGTVSIMYNTVIMCVLGFTKGLEIALISIIAMFISNVVFNGAFQIMSSSNTVFIISDKWEEMAPILMKELHRGITYIPAEGAYTGAPRKLVYSIVYTGQLAKMKRIVKNFDPDAMFSVIETKEVHGRGFGSLN